MCGRFRITKFDNINENFEYVINFEQGEDFFPVYNALPTQRLPVFLDKEPDKLVKRRWGLVPSWWKEAKFPPFTINAQCETLESKPMWRTCFKSKRCIIPSTGFYEWKPIDKKTKQPYYIYGEDSETMLFAGLWDCWTNKETGEQVESFTIITTEPSERMSFLHNRMPVIIDKANVEQWLDPKADCKNLTQLFKGKVNINAVPVSALKANDEPEILGAPIY